MAANGDPHVVTFPSQVMTLGEALRLAMDFERSASVLYKDLASKVDSQARPLFLELSAVGKAHYERLRSLARSIELEQEMKNPVTIPPSAKALRGYISLPELPDETTEDDVLYYAEGRGRIVCDYYGSLAHSIPPGPLRDLFLRFRDDQKRHEADIRSCWAALFLIF